MLGVNLPFMSKIQLLIFPLQFAITYLATGLSELMVVQSLPHTKAVVNIAKKNSRTQELKAQ